MEKSRNEQLYEKLYREAWDHFEDYWTHADVECKVEIVQVKTGGDDVIMDTHVRIRSHAIHVHRVVQSGVAKSDIWERAVKELLNAGPSKIYEISVMIARNKYGWPASKNSERLYPLVPSEAY